MTDNELIAEFHGWKHSPTPKGKGAGLWNFPEWGKSAYKSNAFCYNDSWDWLMAVVEKIERGVGMENVVSIDWSGCRIQIDGSSDICRDTFGALTKLEATYNAVVAFIRFYNENLKP